MTTQPQLTVSGLDKRFGSEYAHRDVDLTVDRDEIVALLGPSGCGKTTLLRCIAGVEVPDSGEVRIGGETVQSATVSRPPEDRDLGMVFQNYAIWPHKTVYENVVFPLKYADNPVPSSEYEDRVEEILDLVQIRELKDAPATDLSGGQQQRTSLARSLVHDPDLLLMDEPLSNLDRELRKEMRDELQRLQHELGVSVLYVTHDQEEAFYLADRVVLMRDGETVERGRPGELHRRPSSPFTRRFVGVHNRFEGTVDVDADGDRVVRTDLVEFPLDNVDFVSDGVTTGSVSCFLRPADVEIGGFAGRPDGRLELTGTVVAEGILGDAYEMTVAFDGAGTDLVVHSETVRDRARGDEIRLHVRPESIQVYPITDA
ncbi:ABC transporter ATP-binding protein [Halosimplex sp. TS25]|uniref:ABC transporter ATP-binding protein n=1 Tax=Halosimplex rarum TaxID=3396619 RepID=UPI0039E75000